MEIYETIQKPLKREKRRSKNRGRVDVGMEEARHEVEREKKVRYTSRIKVLALLLCRDFFGDAEDMKVLFIICTSDTAAPVVSDC